MRRGLSVEMVFSRENFGNGRSLMLAAKVGKEVAP